MEVIDNEIIKALNRITYIIYVLYEFCNSGFLISNLCNEVISTSKFEIRSGGTINRVALTCLKFYINIWWSKCFLV